HGDAPAFRWRTDSYGPHHTAGRGGVEPISRAEPESVHATGSVQLGVKQDLYGGPAAGRREDRSRAECPTAAVRANWISGSHPTSRGFVLRSGVISGVRQHGSGTAVSQAHQCERRRHHHLVAVARGLGSPGSVELRERFSKVTR